MTRTEAQDRFWGAAEVKIETHGTDDEVEFLMLEGVRHGLPPGSALRAWAEARIEKIVEKARESV